MRVKNAICLQLETYCACGSEFSSCKSKILPFNFPPKAFRIFEIQIFWVARVENWPVKANFINPTLIPEDSTPPSKETVEDPDGSAIDPNSIIDISSYMDEEGHLDWEAPPGNKLRINLKTKHYSPLRWKNSSFFLYPFIFFHETSFRIL